MSTDSAAQEPRPQQPAESTAPVPGEAATAQAASRGGSPASTSPAGASRAGTSPAGTSPTGASPARTAPRTGPRTGPIVWGALILAFCGYAAQRAFGPGGMDTAWWITATVIGLGALLLVVGIAVAIRNRG